MLGNMDKDLYTTLFITALFKMPKKRGMVRFIVISRWWDATLALNISDDYLNTWT